jgi:hypothetical protein
MWMSEILIVVNSKNADKNALHEIAGAVGYLGGSDVAIDDANTTLTATVPCSQVSTVHHIEGVTYIRPTMTWFKKMV